MLEEVHLGMGTILCAAVGGHHIAAMCAGNRSKVAAACRQVWACQPRGKPRCRAALGHVREGHLCRWGR